MQAATGHHSRGCRAHHSPHEWCPWRLEAGPGQPPYGLAAMGTPGLVPTLGTPRPPAAAAAHQGLPL